MNNFLVSIVMPAYNAEKYIEKSVNSVINQTYQNWELIIIDDKSSDNTKDIVSNFVNIDNRIKLIANNTNSGKPSIAKNLAKKSIKGKYVAFLDSDDLWHKDKLLKQMNFMQSNPEFKLCYTGGYYVDEKRCDIKKFYSKI
jgi:teichuronic acid biosynthesis glycosyltransferase TuaG